MEEKKIKIIRDLCLDIVDPSGLVANVKYVLDNKLTIRKVGPMWIAGSGKKRKRFKVKPTQEYLASLMKQPQDLSRHLEAVDNLKAKIVNAMRGFTPYRQVAAAKKLPACKRCGGTDYKDCRDHLTCANPRCAVVRRKVEAGLDYRNIKEHNQEHGDKNSSNYHTIDPLLSDAANRHTVVRVAPGDDPVNIRKLTAANKRLHKDEVSKADEQKIRAKEAIEHHCADLNPSIAKKALVTFCQFRESQDKLPRENHVIAACLFYALPTPKIYPQDTTDASGKRKRYSSPGPYNDTKQKRLKYAFIPKVRSNTL